LGWVITALIVPDFLGVMLSLGGHAAKFDPYMQPPCKSNKLKLIFGWAITVSD
jgi:hypothetical protein